ncbi:hypothetical protein DID88_003250 [Monilinia fructigena]|uniref:Uncharacterized protein n=1 Tax=Monilinia fructigena TaxID=38457 RepID=A0A395IUX6_9HELO|nr:hypothetical protein DID88_003250 [Monilinia fructigena]
MASTSKSTPTTSAPRRKSSGPKEKNTMIITLKLSPGKLRGVEAIKKKAGVKRSSTAALGSETTPRIRGKPGPKKKARLDDGTIDPTGTTPRASNNGGHKLGPKANQGAINAGLRALDRSGKPCRKWEKRSFIIKDIHSTEGSATSDSSKDNKDNSLIESEKSNSAMDIDHATNIASSPGSASAPQPQPQIQTQAQTQTKAETQIKPLAMTASV